MLPSASSDLYRKGLEISQLLSGNLPSRLEDLASATERLYQLFQKPDAYPRVMELVEPEVLTDNDSLEEDIAIYEGTRNR